LTMGSTGSSGAVFAQTRGAANPRLSLTLHRALGSLRLKTLLSFMFTAEHRNLELDVLARFAALVILLHALVIGPLLVHCFPSDGSSLVELVGYDPCHHARPMHLVFPGKTMVFLAFDGGDSCVDLMMDSPGVSESGMEPASTSGVNADTIVEQANSAHFPEPMMFTSHSLARGPGFDSTAAPMPVLSLRI
jgi:hypothetical protein